MLATYGFHLEQPWWLLAGVLVVPAIWLARRSLRALGPVRRAAAIALRTLVMLLLAAVLARPALTRTHDKMTVLAVIDRSQSIPAQYWQKAATDANYLPVDEYLKRAMAPKPPGDQLAVVDVAERADITRLPSTDADVPKRSLSLSGEESRLAAGLQLALAIAPPNTAVRILFISDGNETWGDLRAVARVAAANGIRIDVLPLRYRYDREVAFRRLVAPGRARSGQTIPLRFVLTSTHEAAGRITLTLNDRPVDLDPDSDELGVAVRLKAGTNVQTVSLPVGSRGVHEFRASFVPAGPGQDKLPDNNTVSTVTFVAGEGHVLVVSQDPREAASLIQALKDAKVDARPVALGDFPQSLTGLLDADAVVLVNTPCYDLSAAQQEMICRYVTDLGGGLITIGGPSSYGAGGWIGSPVANILPVDLDPPQKKQMPKGALCLIMHACEMPRGNFWGKEVAKSAVKALSRQDLVGVLDFSWNAGMRNWVYQLGPVGDRTAVLAAIDQMVMGDMPDFGPPVEAAYQALKNVRAGQKHIIIISDGDPQLPNQQIINGLINERITCTGVAVFPHSPQDVASLQLLAAKTHGRFYNVSDPSKLPQIFIKEAQVVRRSLIVENPIQPKITAGASELMKGVASVPRVDGFVLTGRKGGLNELLLSGPEEEPILASTQAGLGRVVSFTSTADSRWAASWVAWGGFGRFWEQAVRWVARSAMAGDCEAFADVQGRNVILTVEAVQPGGSFVQFANLAGQVIAPDMTTAPLELRQIGPGQYRSEFLAGGRGSYLVNLRYRRAGEGEQYGMTQTVVNVPFAPEFDDLTDNAALMHELAESTGGRVLPADPQRAELFSRSGIVPPQTALPLTEPLFLAWVALFLLDVGVRRIALDLRAMVRKAAERLRLRQRVAESATLAALKSRRKAVQQRLGGGRDAHAGKRFLAGKEAATELSQADLSAPVEKARPAAKEPTPAASTAAADQQTHVSRLLDAKKRARDQREGKA